MFDVSQFNENIADANGSIEEIVFREAKHQDFCWDYCICLFIYLIFLSVTKDNSNLDASFTLCNYFKSGLVMKSNGYSKIAHNQFTN